MPVGAAQVAFRVAAARDGIQLETAKVPWINQRGHSGLPQEAAETAGAALAAIFLALRGQSDVQAGKRMTALPGDFYYSPTGTFIETDELQHFTTFRLQHWSCIRQMFLSVSTKTSTPVFADNWRVVPTSIERQRMRRALGWAGGSGSVGTTTHCATGNPRNEPPASHPHSHPR